MHRSLYIFVFICSVSSFTFTHSQPSLPPLPTLTPHSNPNLSNSSTPTPGFSLSVLSTESFYLSFPYGYEIENGLAVTLMATGATFILLGVRLFRYVLFLLAFYMFGGATYFIASLLGHSSSSSFIAALVIGVFFAFIIIQLWKLSLFACGAAVGFVCWLGFRSLWPDVLTSPLLLYGALLIPCLIFGFFAIRLERVWLLFATPVLGSFLLAQGLDFYIQQHMNVFRILNGTNECNNAQCEYVYGGLIATSLLGVLVQWKYTSGMAGPDGGGFPSSSSSRRRSSSSSSSSSSVELVEEVKVVKRPRPKKKIKKIVYVDEEDEEEVTV